MANYVQYRTTRFDLRGGMTPEFREAVNNNLHDLINPFYILSVKEIGAPDEVFGWSEGVDWEAINWDGAKVKLLCDGWVNEFVVDASNATHTEHMEDARIFDYLCNSKASVGRHENGGYPENGEEYIKGLFLCIRYPKNKPCNDYPFFLRPDDELIAVYEKYMNELGGFYSQLYLYSIRESQIEGEERTYGITEACFTGGRDEWGLYDTDTVSKGIQYGRYSCTPVYMPCN